MIHELGHFFAGKILHWRFYYIIFGPIKISYSPIDGFHLNWITELSRWGGAIAIMPAKTGAINRFQISFVVAGGPIITLISALLTLKTIPILSYALFIVGFLTILPYRKGNVYSDGGKLRQLMLGGQGADNELTVFRIGYQVMKDGHFTNVDMEDIQVLISSADIRDQYKGYYYLWCLYRDRGNDFKALEVKNIIKELSRSLPISLQKHLQKPI